MHDAQKKKKVNNPNLSQENSIGLLCTLFSFSSANFFSSSVSAAPSALIFSSFFIDAWSSFFSTSAEGSSTTSSSFFPSSFIFSIASPSLTSLAASSLFSSTPASLTLSISFCSSAAELVLSTLLFMSLVSVSFSLKVTLDFLRWRMVVLSEATSCLDFPQPILLIYLIKYKYSTFV
ncbi:hypothetical protein MtrunA17_Chr2g0286321 [Medicago truncatula]|uniref:Transmembrane protein n=1 Tax=Medicago truncatula TaxID=3880 RepID=A0A396J660_MEDTR|nr:hypothetical protein MtrunA17_Chr2g0286321 [Medicago truncatula]